MKPHQAKPFKYTDELALSVFRDMFESMAYPNGKKDDDEHDKLHESDSDAETS
jgi:hypothetical protein